MTGKVQEYRDVLNRFTLSGLAIFLTLTAGLCAWGIYYLRASEGLVTIEAMDIAQEARFLYRGEGFRTGFIKPLSLLKQEAVLDPPDLYNSPAYVFFLSLFYKLAGVADSAVLGGSLLWAFLTGVLLLVFCALVSNLWYALALFFIYVTNLGVIESAFSGLPVAFLSFFILFFAVLFSHRNPDSLVWTALLGAVFAMLYLAEFDFGLLLIPVLAMLTLDARGKRWRHAAVFALVFILVTSPWLVRNARLTGNPIFSLRWHDFKAFSRLFPANRVARDFNPQALLQPFPFPDFYRKFSGFVRLMYRYWLSLGHSPLLPFFLISVFIKGDDPRRCRFIRLAYVLFFCELVLVAAGNGDFARLLAFTPVILYSGMITFLRMLDSALFPKLCNSVGGPSPACPDDYWGRDHIVGAASSPRSDRAASNGPPTGRNHEASGNGVASHPMKGRWLILIFCLVCVYPGIMALAVGLPDQRYVSASFSGDQARVLKKGGLSKIKNLVRPDEAVISDIPWAVSWYANRSAIWLPWTVEQAREIKKKLKGVRFLYLTPVLFKYPEAENVADWRSIYQSGMVPEWLQVDRGLLLPGDDLILGDVIFERLDLE